MNTTPLISIVVPVKNGDAWLDKTIQAYLSQTLADQVEVIIIDSGSTDNTLTIVNKYPVRFVKIDSSSFNHGQTRNLGAIMALGKFVVMTVQDAIPVDCTWLEKLLEPFADPDVVGVCGMQIVPHDLQKNPLEWFRPISSLQVYKFHYTSPDIFDELSAIEKKTVCAWDNVNAMYRKDDLIRYPFQKVNYAEDALWARNVLRAGRTIAFNPKAQVSHYHHESSDYAFKRRLTVSYHMYSYFGVFPKKYPSGILFTLKILKLFLFKLRIPFRYIMPWLKYNYHQALAIKRADKLFFDSYNRGEIYLQELHNKICGVPPQAPKSQIIE